jgi:hypothetical protein
MTDRKTIRPTGSYTIVVPSHIREDSDGRVSSFWIDGKPLLLQISSYARTEGPQVNAADRLAQRMAKTVQPWNVWARQMHPDTTVDQATAEYLDENGLLWIYTYLVWPHLTMLATISGPEEESRNQDSWASHSISSIRLAVH